MENEIAVRDEASLQPVGVIADGQIEALAATVEKRMQALRTIVKACIQRTNPTDWIDQGGKPYLQASGAEKLRWPLGISWRIDNPQREDLEGGHFSYTFKGYFSMGGIEIEAIGARSTKDPFFNKYDYSQKDTEGNKIKTQLPPSEIDHNDVKKSAMTNCIGNGITRLLGIRNMSWDELKEAGLDTSKVGKVTYQTTGKEESGEAQDNRAEIRRMILEMAGGNDAKAKTLLQDFTSFIPAGKTEKERVKGKSSVADLSEKAVNVTYGKVKEKYAAWQKENPKGEPGSEGITPRDVFLNAEANIPLCETIEDVNGIFQYAESHGVAGEDLAKLRLQADKKKTEIREKGN